MTEQEKALRKTRTKQFEPCPGTPTGCICRDLIRLYEQDKLPLHCGKISRFRAAQLLHIPKTSLLKSSRSPRFAVARKCVSHVDHHLQRWGHGTPWQERIPAIEARLRDLKEAGRLPTNSKGDLSRSAVLKPFGAETYVAQVTQLHPEIKALLDRYDITRADPSYGRHKHAPRAPDLRELLEAPDLVLTRQYRINQRELNSKLGIPNYSIRETPDLLALVKSKQAEIDRRCREGVTRKTFKLWGVEHLNRGATPYSEPHKRVFNFTRLSELYGLAFAEYVGTAFVAVVASKTDVNKYLNRITHFLEWLADDELSTAIAKAVSHGGTIDTMQFEECAYRYQREVYFAYVGSADKKPGGQSHIAGFQVIEQLSEAGVFPRVRFPRITLRAFARRKTAATPSLAEARIEPGAQDVLRVAEAAASGDAPVDLGDDAVRFAETINLERQRRPDLPASLPAAIRAICEERLLALRRAASTVFEEWRKDYEWARGEIARAPHSGADASRMLEEAWASDNIMQGRQTVTRLFPPRDTTTALRQLLALIDANFGGICPQSNSLATSGFWEHAYSKVGGCPKVQALLTPTRQVCSAVTVLYLCETGANVSTALSLSPDSIQPSGISGRAIFCSLGGSGSGLG